MDKFLWLAGLGLCLLWLLAHRKRLAEEASEVLQLPALRHDARTWTALDELVLNIARHDVLARWHDEGRQLLLDAPVEDEGIEGGWEMHPDGFGKEIGDRYEQLFSTISAMPRSKRIAVLRSAESRSEQARKNLQSHDVINPDGSVHKFPSWMVYS